MKSSKLLYIHRSPSVVLKVAQAGNGFWTLFVGDMRADYFEDERDAVKCALEKRTGFAEWDETSFACPAELDDWERI